MVGRIVVELGREDLRAPDKHIDIGKLSMENFLVRSVEFYKADYVVFVDKDNRWKTMKSRKKLNYEL